MEGGSLSEVLLPVPPSVYPVELVRGPACHGETADTAVMKSIERGWKGSRLGGGYGDVRGGGWEWWRSRCNG